VKKSLLTAFVAAGFSSAFWFQKVARLKAASTKHAADFFTPSELFRTSGGTAAILSQRGLGGRNQKPIPNFGLRMIAA